MLNVARSSTLVSISPIMPKVVLQLPRGNLEGIHPRALVLPHITMSLIDRRKFDIALDMMRRQKVDMNLIVDMSPTGYLDGGGLRTMVEQVENMNHLNLFIASLTNYNITEWKYPIPSWLLRARHEDERDIANEEEIFYSKQTTFDFSKKVNRVCSKMRLEMIALDGKNPHKTGKFLLPILSTFAKENPPQLESALDLIRKDAIESATELQLSKKRSILLVDQAQGSIKYLAFLAEYVLTTF
jgi:elongator complex protein 1